MQFPMKKGPHFLGKKANVEFKIWNNFIKISLSFISLKIGSNTKQILKSPVFSEVEGGPLSTWVRLLKTTLANNRTNPKWIIIFLYDQPLHIKCSPFLLHDHFSITSQLLGWPRLVSLFCFRMSNSLTWPLTNKQDRSDQKKEASEFK